MPTFQKYSEGTVASFLNSVIVIDDQAFQQTKTDTSEKVSRPGRMQTPSTAEAPARKDDFQDIDTEGIIKAFSAKGLICSVVSGKDDSVLPAAKAADVVIVDWQMEGDNGNRAIELIEKMLVADDGNRSRFLCIYSGVTELNKITEKLTQKELFKDFSTTGDFFISKDNISITVLSKSGGQSEKSWPDRAVGNNELPDRIIAEYAAVNGGLLEHATLRALAAVRKNTHRLLEKFSKDMDAPFLSHRIYTSPIEEVKNHVAPLITAEIQSIVEQAQLNECLTREAICKWIDGPARAKLNGEIVERESVDELVEIAKYYITNGGNNGQPQGVSGHISGAHGKLHTKSKRKESKFTGFLGSNKPLVDEKKFAALTSLVTRYGDSPPTLGPGTILFYNNNYFLCVMPGCDSARIPIEGRAFPFLLLKKNEKECDIVVSHNSNYVELKVVLQAYNGMFQSFAPASPMRDIEATKDRTTNKWRFLALANNNIQRSYQWVGTLKPSHAQSIINAYSSYMSRVGVTESAWLHFWKSKMLGGGN